MCLLLFSSVSACTKRKKWRKRKGISHLHLYLRAYRTTRHRIRTDGWRRYRKKSVVALYLLLLLVVDSSIWWFGIVSAFSVSTPVYRYLPGIGLYPETGKNKKTSTNVTQNGWVYHPNISGSYSVRKLVCSISNFVSLKTQTTLSILCLWIV